MIFPFLRKFFQLFPNSHAPARLLECFEQNRPALEQQFFENAANAGIPRGLRWVHCEWTTTRSLLKDRSNGQICLLTGINVSFEAIEGGDMEGVAAVSLIRDACAVFQLHEGRWKATGRALFNMNPAEAQEKLAASYEPYIR